MTLQQLRKILAFYGRFTPSFSAIGYNARKLRWREPAITASDGQWLVTGASGGIGAEVVRSAAGAGARVIAVARSAQKLDALLAGLPPEQRARVTPVTCDLSLVAATRSLVERLAQEGCRIDVLVNNVGLLLDDLAITAEGLETSFATNLLNHFVLTEGLLQQELLADDAVTVNVSSGGMYNMPLRTDWMNNTGSTYHGTVAYGLHKRGQVALADYWRAEPRNKGRAFYVMHPGWADTSGVQQAMPRFRKILKSVLRDAAQGADTILWLASHRPPQQEPELIWLDRKPRTAHVYAHTRQAPDTPASLVAYLQATAASVTAGS